MTQEPSPDVIPFRIAYQFRAGYPTTSDYGAIKLDVYRLALWLPQGELNSLQLNNPISHDRQFYLWDVATRPATYRGTHRNLSFRPLSLFLSHPSNRSA